MPRRHPHLSTYLLLVFGVLTAVQLVSGVLISRSGLEIAEAGSREGRRAAAAALARTVEINFAFARDVVVAAADRPGMRRFVSARERDKVQRVATNIVEGTPHYKAVYVLDPQLELLAAVPRAPSTIRFREQLARAVKTRDAYTSAPAESSFDGGLITLVAVPVTSADNDSVAAIIVAEISFVSIANDVLELRYGGEGTGRLLDAQGRVLAAAAGETTIAELPTVRERSRDGTHFSYVAADDEPMVASAVPCTEYGWQVVVAQPKRQADTDAAGLRGVAFATLGIGGGLLLIGGGG